MIVKGHILFSRFTAKIKRNIYFIMSILYKEINFTLSLT